MKSAAKIIGTSSLWKYNRISGMWDYQRDVNSETAIPWLTRFQKDEPEETFQISDRRPKAPRSVFARKVK